MTENPELSIPKQPCDSFGCPATATENSNFSSRGRMIPELHIGLCSLHWSDAMQQRGSHEEMYDAANRFVRKSLGVEK